MADCKPHAFVSGSVGFWLCLCLHHRHMHAWSFTTLTYQNSNRHFAPSRCCLEAMLLASTSPISCAQRGQIEIRSVLGRKGYRWQKPVCMAASKPLAVISGTARYHGIGRECAKQSLEVHETCLDIGNGTLSGHDLPAACRLDTKWLA